MHLSKPRSSDPQQVIRKVPKILGERSDLRGKKEANKDPERGELQESLSNPTLASSDLDRALNEGSEHRISQLTLSSVYSKSRLDGQREVEFIVNKMA